MEIKTKTILVRSANLFDTDQIISLGRAMHQESPRFKSNDFSISKCHTGLAEVIPAGGVFVAELGEEMVGCLVGMLTHHFFGSTLQASDLMLYVKPRWRGSRAAYLLIKTFEAWARASNAKVIQLGISAEIDSAKIRGFYEKMGYRTTGSITVKEIK